MAGLASYELWFYGGIAVMVLAGLLLALQTVLFLIKRQSLGRTLDEAYGQPQKYNIKGEGTQIWLQ